jgi:hypothetical protein
VAALPGQSLNEWVSFYAAGENLRDVRYEVARTPILNVGPPRTLRVGLRVRLSGTQTP